MLPMSHAPLHPFMRQMSVLDREQYSTEERTKLLLSYSFWIGVGKKDAALCLEQQAHLFGVAQYQAAHNQWAKAADLMEQLAEQESRLINSL